VKDSLLFVLVAAVLLVPAPSFDKPVVPSNEGDLWDVASEEFRHATASVLRAYSGEDLKEDRILTQFGKELADAQEKSFGPVAEKIYESEDRVELADQLDRGELHAD